MGLTLENINSDKFHNANTAIKENKMAFSINEQKESREIIEDILLKTLTEKEKDELFILVQEAQVLNPSKPSH